MAAPWITASVIPQVVRNTKKPNITDTALPTTGVKRKRTRKGNNTDGNGGHDCPDDWDPLVHGEADAKTGGGDLAVTLHEHGCLVIVLEIKVVEDFGDLALLDDLFRGGGGAGGKVQGTGEQCFAGVQFNRIGWIKIGLAADLLYGLIVIGGIGINGLQAIPGISAGDIGPFRVGGIIIDGIDCRIDRCAQVAQKIRGVVAQIIK